MAVTVKTAVAPNTGATTSQIPNVFKDVAVNLGRRTGPLTVRPQEEAPMSKSLSRGNNSFYLLTRSAYQLK